MNFDPTLLEAVRTGRLVPFAGAGVSMAILHRDGQRLFPSWYGLLKRAAEALGDRGEADLIHGYLKSDAEDAYLEAAKAARQGLSGSRWREFLEQALSPPWHTIDPGSLDLARTLWGLGSRLVVTTNYDRTLKWACPPAWRPDLVEWRIANPAGQAALRQGKHDRPTLWHLHGTIDEPDRLILTPDGYMELYDEGTEQPYRAALETLDSLLTSHHFLFVGFSLGDARFVNQLRFVDKVYDGNTGPHYALIHSSEARSVRQLGTGVELIEFEDFDGLPDILRELGTHAPEATLAPDPSTDADSTPAAGIPDTAPAVPTGASPSSAEPHGDELTDDEWDHLLESIRAGHCIPVLGPGVFEDSHDGEDSRGGDATVPPELLEGIDDSARGMIDTRNLFQVAEAYLAHPENRRKHLEDKVIDFYGATRSTFPEALRQLTGLGFHTYISLTQHPSLERLLADQSPRVEVYDFRGRQAEAPAGPGTDHDPRPLIYYLHGHIDQPASLVLTEQDILRSVTALASDRPGLLPSLSHRIQQPETLFLLLGCGLGRWYLRPLLHKLGVTQRERRSYLLESMTRGTAPNPIIVFLENRQVSTCHMDLHRFTAELAQRFESHLPIDEDSAAGDTVALLHGPDDHEFANRLAGVLEDLDFTPILLDPASAEGSRQQLDTSRFSAVIVSRFFSDHAATLIPLIDRARTRHSPTTPFLFPILLDQAEAPQELQGIKVLAGTRDDDFLIDRLGIALVKQRTRDDRARR